MIEYQNIFTQVQVRGPAEMGLDNEAGTMAAERMGVPWFSNLAGVFGNAQIGPMYLGWTGMIGLTMLAWQGRPGKNRHGKVSLDGAGLEGAGRPKIARKGPGTIRLGCSDWKPESPG